MSQRALADRCRLGEHAETAERFRNRDQLRRILRDELSVVAVEPRDSAFAVVAGQTRVRGFLGAGEAMPAGPTDGRSDELAAREAVAVSLDDGQRLVAEDEQRLVHRWGAEEAFGNLAVGAAHSHFERAEEHFALACLDGRNVL